jgi:Phage integrase family
MRFHDPRHTLRHTSATLLLCRGVHPKVVSEMLGHTRISTTLDLYSHGRGRKIKVRWRTAGQSYDCPLSAVEVDEEIRCTAHNYRENDEEFQLGDWHVEWWLDGEQICKVPFKVIRVAGESRRT